MVDLNVGTSTGELEGSSVPALLKQGTIKKQIGDSIGSRRIVIRLHHVALCGVQLCLKLF